MMLNASRVEQEDSNKKIILLAFKDTADARTE
jgi:hypothetical protein